MYVFKKMLTNDVITWERILRRKVVQCKASIKLSILDEFIGQNNDTSILLHKLKSKSQKPKQVSNGRLKPLKKKVSKRLLRNWEISQKGLLQISHFLMRLKETSTMRMKRGTCCQILRLVRKSQCFPKNIN